MRRFVHGIREMFNVPRLYEEKGLLHQEIAELQRQNTALRKQPPIDNFVAVSSDFDARQIEKAVIDRVVDEIAPLVRDHLLRAIVPQLLREKNRMERSRLSIAFDPMAQNYMVDVALVVHHIRFPVYQEAIGPVTLAEAQHEMAAK